MVRIRKFYMCLPLLPSDYFVKTKIEEAGIYSPANDNKGGNNAIQRHKKSNKS